MQENILALIAATTVLILIPGPNAALIVATSLSHGLRFGIITVVGTTIGIMLQLIMVVGGVAAIVDTAASALTWIKWLGVAYLLFLGIRTWFESPGDLAQLQDRGSLVESAGAVFGLPGVRVRSPKRFREPGHEDSALPYQPAGGDAAALEPIAKLDAGFC